MPTAGKRVAATFGVVAATVLLIGISGGPANAASATTAATTASDSLSSPNLCAMARDVTSACSPEPPDQCPVAPTTVTGFVNRSPYYSMRLDLSYCFTRLGDLKVSGNGLTAFFAPPPPVSFNYTGSWDFSNAVRTVTNTFTGGSFSASRTVQFEVQLCNFVVTSPPGIQTFSCFATEFPYIQINVSKFGAPVVKQGVSSFAGIP